MKPIVFDLYNIIVQLFYIKKINNIKTPNSKSKSDKNISIRHNLNELKKKVFTTSRRVEIGYQIATTPWRDVSKEKLLVIGCRNLVELKQATFFGFEWRNIDGADLFSTHPKIIKTNMENMKIIKSKSYNTVTLINTLAYSTKPDKVFAEVNRVLKPGGFFIFNFAFHLTKNKLKSSYSDDIFPDVHFINHSFLTKIFKKNKFFIYFHYALKEKNLKDGSRIQPTWYGLKKADI